MGDGLALHALGAEERGRLIGDIHAAPGMVVLAVTGGGVASLADLLLVPGASRTVLEAAVPYAASALAGWVGRGEAGSVSEATAQAMAEHALARALALRPDADTVVAGVACTAALVTDRERRGGDRACISVAHAGGVHVATLELEKARSADAARARVEQDRRVADAVLLAVARAVGA